MNTDERSDLWLSSAGCSVARCRTFLFHGGFPRRVKSITAQTSKATLSRWEGSVKHKGSRREPVLHVGSPA
jgi:hypothetical protein